MTTEPIDVESMAKDLECWAEGPPARLAEIALALRQLSEQNRIQRDVATQCLRISLEALDELSPGVLEDFIKGYQRALQEQPNGNDYPP